MSIFTAQLTQRIHEQQCINKDNWCLGLDTENENSTDTLLENSDVHTYVQKEKPCYSIYRVGNNTFCNWLTKTRTTVPEVLIEFIGEVLQEKDLDSLDIYTEIIHKKKHTEHILIIEMMVHGSTGPW
jgi:hypothetical protein